MTVPRNKPQKTPVHYSRRKDSEEINGNPVDVKVLVFVDLLLAQVWPMILTIILLLLLPKASLLPWCVSARTRSRGHSGFAGLPMCTCRCWVFSPTAVALAQ